MTRLRSESGQAVVVAVAFMLVLVGMTGLVLDIGSWFRAQRATQAAADAAALAGAQALPVDQAGAYSDASDSITNNGGGTPTISFLDGEEAGDTIRVELQRPGDRFFSQIFRSDAVNVKATAAARSFKPGAAKWVAPIVVRITHPDLCPDTSIPLDQCQPTFNVATSLPLAKTGAPGAFDLLNLDPSQTNGTVGTSTMATWIDRGFDQYLPLGGYYSDPGVKFNSSQIDAALADRLQTELLFPVYDTLTGTGSNATYHIVAWVGFHLTGYSMSGTGGSISGYFTRTIWDGVESTDGDNSTDLGVRSVALVQ